MKKSASWLSGLLVLTALLLIGCLKMPPPTTAPAGGAPTPVVQAEGPRPGQVPSGAAQTPIRRAMDRQLVQNLLKQIGIFYQMYKDETQRPPAKLDDFLDYIKRDGAKEHQALKEGYLVLNLAPNLTGKNLLCYEKDPNTDGSRLVLMGDCNSVRIMNAADFQAAMK